MTNTEIAEILSKWDTEIKFAFDDSKSLCIALLSTDGNLIFANQAMLPFLREQPSHSFINPSFEKLLSAPYENSLIFNGFITMGDQSSFDSSLWVQIFRKKEEILILGGVDSRQLVENNNAMHHLNHEINSLQRELIKEKLALQNALDQLRKTNKNLKEANATKDKFFSIIAHDLSTPFNSILGFSDVLMNTAYDTTPEDIVKFAKIINDSSQNAYDLLKDLLEWSRLQMGKLIPEFKEIMISKLIDDLFDICEPIAKTKRINLVAHYDEDLRLMLDKKMMDTVLRNLVSNAIKFTFPEGDIKIQCEQLETETIFCISDNGIGIEEEYIHTLFDVDCKLSKKGTNNEKGTGLGLILCKEFVESHNGEIWVESDVGKGSQFKFSIPLISP